MHYNAARFYTELKDRSLPRFATAVTSSFGLSALVYMAIASFGYLTFGGNCDGYILNNYSPYDPLAGISRLAVGLAVLVRVQLFTSQQAVYLHAKIRQYSSCADGLPHSLFWSP